MHVTEMQLKFDLMHTLLKKYRVPMASAAFICLCWRVIYGCACSPFSILVILLMFLLFHFYSFCRCGRLVSVNYMLLSLLCKREHTRTKSGENYQPCGEDTFT